LRCRLLGPGFSHRMGSSGRQLLLVSERRAWRECGRTACGWSRRRAERRVRSRVREVEKKSRAGNGASSCSPGGGTVPGRATRLAPHSAREQLGWRLPHGTGGGDCVGPRNGGPATGAQPDSPPNGEETPENMATTGGELMSATGERNPRHLPRRDARRLVGRSEPSLRASGKHGRCESHGTGSP
jgi:hypothetical protein